MKPRAIHEHPTFVHLQRHVTDFLTANDHVGYNRFTDFDWSALKESVLQCGLTDVHVGAVETAMLIEDHIPGYASEYIQYFMLDEDRTDEEAWTCRQMLHFVYRWVAEEDRHAHCLELWLRNCGRREAGALTALMVMEGKKRYVIPHVDPAQLFTYTTLQEKATQLFYSCLRNAVDEPVLRSVLGKLAQDEARHCHFFSQLALDTLQTADSRRVVQIREALEQFQMPLATMLENYRRKAAQMTRTATGYDYRDALDYFARLVKQSMEARTLARSSNLQDLLLFTQKLKPQR